MIFYVFQYLILLFIALIDPKKISNIIYYLLILILSITIGLRYQVGGDWGTYLDNYHKLYFYSYQNFYQNFLVREPGWALLSFISKMISPREIWPLNLICALIFMTGINTICQSTNRKYLALTICYPILIILVGMGYTRQSVAMGFCFLSLKYIGRNDKKYFFLFSLFAFMFHNTSIIFSVSYYLFNNRKKILNLNNVIILSIILILIIFSPLWTYYNNMVIEYMFLANYMAEGAIPRGIPIVLASLGFLFLSKYISNMQVFDKNISKLSIALFTFFIIVAPFTAIDRIYLYFSPIYIFFISNIRIKNKSFDNIFYESFVGIVFLLSIIIWFSYGKNYSYWLPYDNYLFHMNL